MKLPRIAVNRPVTITILVAVVFILGFVSLSRLAVIVPISLPVAAAITNYAGRSGGNGPRSPSPLRNVGDDFQCQRNTVHIQSRLR